MAGEVVNTLTLSVMNLHLILWMVTEAELLPTSVMTNMELLAKEYTGLEQGAMVTVAAVPASAPSVRDVSVRVRAVSACGA